MLKQAENGASVDEVCRKTGIGDVTFYASRKKYAGLMPSGMRCQLEEEIFYSLAEARALIEARSRQYNTVWLPSSLRPPPTGPGSGDAAITGLQFRFAPPMPGNGGGDDNGLTNNPDRSVEAAERRNPIARSLKTPTSLMNQSAAYGPPLSADAG